jgi:outer membrane receptor protein involved in Fe transport
MSFAQILDPVSNRIFNGGLFPYPNWDGNLSETRINNIDLRWEYFLEAGQIFSASVFYKSFDDPIELVRIPAAQTTIEFQPRNVGDAEVYGVELEFAKNFDFISPGLRYFSFNGNLTLIESIIDMTEVEFNSRKNFEREGQNIDDTRQMAGQAPYVINAGLTYNNYDAGIDAGFFYNVKGPTLEIVGVGLYPDVFTQPFHSLNFSFNYKFGPNDNTTIDFGISNILDDKLESFFESFRAEPEVFNRRSPGRAFSLGISHNF